VKLENQEKIWAHFQNNDRDSFSGARVRLDFIVRQIKDLSLGEGSKVLNVGVGEGYLEERLHELGYQVSTVDPDGRAIARITLKGIDAIQGRVEDLSDFPDQCFDVVVASEVLEHLSTDQLNEGLGEVSRVLKAGGHFIGTVPYKENLNDNEVACPKCSEVFHRWGHLQAFDVVDIYNALSINFSDITVKRTIWVEFLGRDTVGKVKSAIRWVLGMFGVQLAGPKIYFSALHR